MGQSITGRLRLPRDITVRFDDCDQEQTTWSSERREVLLCDGTVRGVAQALQQALPVAGALAGQDATGALARTPRPNVANECGATITARLAWWERRLEIIRLK